MTYKFVCTCGHEVTADAEGQEEAIEKIKGIMTEEAVAQHMAEKHPGDPVPSKEQYDMLLSQNVQPA